jgi:enhancing lycopene biosynthesis protein 2
MLDILIIAGGQGPIKSWITGFAPGEQMRLIPELAVFLREFRDAGGVLGVLSLAEFISTAFEGEWPEGRGGLDLNPEEVLLDREKGRALCPGNLTATSLPQLRKGIDLLLERLLELRMAKDSQ